MRNLVIRSACVFLGLLSFCGCGGSNNSDPPRSAILRLGTTGTLPPDSPALAGVGITVALPDGVSIRMQPDGSVDPSVVTPSGQATNATAAAVHTASTATEKAKIVIVVAANDSAGFGTGEFATVSCYVASGTSLQGFSLTNLQPTALPKYQTVTGFTATQTLEME